jgi:N-glycosyltransferase
MNVLFTTMPFWGGLRPLVPLAHAVRRAGHRVGVAAPAWFGPTIRRHGLQPVSAGMGRIPAELDRLVGDLQRSQVDPWEWTFTNLVGGLVCQYMAADLLTLAPKWKPDLIVREAIEYGGGLAAEVLGIPHAAVRPRPAGSRLSYAQRAGLHPVLARRRDELGLPPDPDNEMPHRHLELAFLPPSFFGGADLFSERTQFVNFGLEGLDVDVGTEPSERLVSGDRRPTVYASLGTLRHSEPGVMETIVTALRRESVNLIVSAGDHTAARRLRRLMADLSMGPATLTIHEFVDQLAALHDSDVFVTHAGINSVREALTLGVPMIVLPIRDDQPFNAERCVALGVAREVKPDDCLASGIGDAVRAVLRASAYRDAATRAQQSVASLPPVGRAVELLEELVQSAPN